MDKIASQIAATVITKLALNLETARRATTALRSPGKRFFRGVWGLGDDLSLQARRRASQVRGIPIGWGAAQPASAKVLKGFDPQTVAQLKPQFLPGKKSVALAGGKMMDAPKRALRGQGVDRESIADFLQTPAFKKLSPEHKEMANRIGLLHEGVEKRYAGSTPLATRLGGAWSPSAGVSHLHPDVLLQEHNMLATLPKSMVPVRRYYRGLREGADMAALSSLREAIPGFQYGKGQRLSRSARKHLSRKLLSGPD